MGPFGGIIDALKPLIDNLTSKFGAKLRLQTAGATLTKNEAGEEGITTAEGNFVRADFSADQRFPKLVTAIPVSYGAADLLKVSVQFTYDRYIVNPRGSIRKSNTSGFNDISRVSNDSTSFDLDQNDVLLRFKNSSWSRMN